MDQGLITVYIPISVNSDKHTGFDTTLETGDKMNG